MIISYFLIPLNRITGFFTFSGSTSGQLDLATAIDLDTTGVAYNVIVVTVSDGGTPALTGTSTVTVNVGYVNDATPVFGATTPAGTISVSFCSIYTFFVSLFAHTFIN